MKPHGARSARRPLVRFGEFRFELDSLELWRSDAQVDLAPKPARILAALVSRPDELVSRDRLYEVGWPDAVVEYDLALNSAIRQIRVALSDRADEPEFVQTVPRRGYRFIAPVRAYRGRIARGPRRFAAVWSRRGARAAAAIVLGFLALPLLDVPTHRVTVAFVAPRLLDASLEPSAVTRLDQRLRDTAARRSGTAVAVLAAATAPGEADYRIESDLYLSAAGTPRIAVSLIRAHDRSILWSGAFNPRCPEVADPEGFIAAYIARILTSRVS